MAKRGFSVLFLFSLLCHISKALNWCKICVVHSFHVFPPTKCLRLFPDEGDPSPLKAEEPWLYFSMLSLLCVWFVCLPSSLRRSRLHTLRLQHDSKLDPIELDQQFPDLQHKSDQGNLTSRQHLSTLQIEDST